MTIDPISAGFSYPAKFVTVNNAKMHYVEVGEGKPILFLHGIPASCYVWRNILPHLAKLGRCIAPDLIGFGASGKPDIAYTIADQINYIEEFIKALNLKSIALVMHGFGSIIGFDYAMRHEKNCIGLAFYEAFLCSGTGEDISLPYQEQLLNWRNYKNLNETILADASIVNILMQQAVMRSLSQDEMQHYRQPFDNKGALKPLLQYLKELPIGDEKSPADIIIKNYSQKLTESRLPKLMLYSLPGFVTTMSTLLWAKEHLPNIEMVELGEELHLAQESCPDLMGETISVWLQGIEQI